MKSIKDQIRELQLVKEQIEGGQIAPAAIAIALLDAAIAKAKAQAEVEAQAEAKAEVEALYVRWTTFTK